MEIIRKGDVLENITIESLAAEGKAIAKYNQMVIFIPFGAPGDVVDIQITQKKKTFAEAKITQIKSSSTNRVTPNCSHFGLCGGCKWQHVDYPTQLHYKHKQVEDTLSRIGKVELPEINTIEGSKDIYFYRNKLDYTFSNKRWLYSHELGDESVEIRGLGFHFPGRFDRVLDIQKCYLQKDPSNDIRLWLKKYAIDNNLSFYNVLEHKGFLRSVIIRTTNINEIMVLIQFGENKPKVIDALLTAFNKAFQITSLYYFINTKKNDSYHDLDAILYSGQPFIRETMENLTFQVGPKSFYQTNSEQAYTLYKYTREFAGLTGNEVVYDLYTGTGTIANFVAAQAKQVIGIEYVESAIEDAKINSSINNIKNTTFYAGDMKDILTDAFVANHPAPDVIITDPPRAGMHEDVIHTILKVAAKKIVYVSCNPATQARDIELLSTKYKVTKVQPVDMFPHTHHVENIVLLEHI